MAGGDSGSGDGGPGVRDEGLVRAGFWPKLKKSAGRIPFVEDAVAAFCCALDPATPRAVKAVLFGALAYFIVPTDMIPDFIAGLGFIDDASVLAGAIVLVRRYISADHRAAARRFLAADEAGPGTPAPPA